MILVELGPDFLLKQKIFLFGDKLLPVFQHGFLRSAENVYFHNVLVLYGKILFHIILSGIIIGRCLYLFVADVIDTVQDGYSFLVVVGYPLNFIILYYYLAL